MPRRRPLVAALTGVCLSLTLLPAAASAQPTDSALSAAVRSASRGDRDIASFYQRRNYRPLWIENGGFRPEVDKLLSLHSPAEADGLNPREYRLDALIERL